MAWGYVNGQFGELGGSGSSVSTAAFNVAAGNMIVVGVFLADATGTIPTVTGVSDNASPPNTYSVCGSRYLFNSDNYEMYFFVAHNTTARTGCIVTATFSSAVDTGAVICAIQLSGMALSSGHDTGYAPAGNNDTTQPYATTAGSTTGDNEVIVGFWIDAAGSGRTYSSSSPSVFRIQSTSGSFCMATNDAPTSGSYNVAVACSISESHFGYSKAFFVATGATDYPITPSGGSLAASGAASILGLGVLAGAGGLAVAGESPILGHGIPVGAGGLIVEGNAPTLETTEAAEFTPPDGSLELFGYVPTQDHGIVVPSAIYQG